MREKHLVRIAIYVIAVALAFSFALQANAFQASDLLAVKIKATAIRSESIDQVLGHLTEYGVPIGIELADENLSPRRQIRLDLPETSLKDFLDAVIAKDSRYKWKLEQGVIHVLPTQGRDTFVATLLDSKISHFAITGGASRYEILNDIVNVPEIGSQLTLAGVEPMIFLASGSMRRLEEKTSFRETSLTLRELLDKIVLKTEINQWVIMRWGKNNEYITLKTG